METISSNNYYIYVNVSNGAGKGNGMVSLFLRYLYSDYERDSRLLIQQFGSHIKCTEIGQSVRNRPIHQFVIGNGKKRVHISASHHAREWMTTWLVTQQLYYYARLYDENAVIEGVSIREVLDMISLHFVPLVNPDGVVLATEGWQKAGLTAEEYAAMANMNELGEKYWLWKANIRGVDLNRQYPMNWDMIRNSPSRPAAMNFKGERHSSEPEVWAMMKEMMADPPLMTIAYHSAGEEIYWYHGQEGAIKNRDMELALRTGLLTGYALINEDEYFAGGFADWFVTSYQRPGFTIEIGKEPHPVDLRQSKRIWNQNKHVPLMVLRELVKE